MTGVIAECCDWLFVIPKRQHGDLSINDAFGFGPDALQALFWLLLTAFPAVLALSWVFDVTRKGLKRTEPLAEEGKPAAVSGRTRPRVPPAVAFSAGLAISVLVGAVGWRSMQEGALPPGAFAPGLGSASSTQAAIRKRGSRLQHRSACLTGP